MICVVFGAMSCNDRTARSWNTEARICSSSFFLVLHAAAAALWLHQNLNVRAAPVRCAASHLRTGTTIVTPCPVSANACLPSPHNESPAQADISDRNPRFRYPDAAMDVQRRVRAWPMRVFLVS